MTWIGGRARHWYVAEVSQVIDPMSSSALTHPRFFLSHPKVARGEGGDIFEMFMRLNVFILFSPLRDNWGIKF